MELLKDGESKPVHGSGKAVYTLERTGEIYSCTCPAWRFQKVRIEERTCKHLKGLFGAAAEQDRVERARNNEPPPSEPEDSTEVTSDQEGTTYDVIG